MEKQAQLMDQIVSESVKMSADHQIPPEMKGLFKDMWQRKFPNGTEEDWEKWFLQETLKGNEKWNREMEEKMKSRSKSEILDDESETERLIVEYEKLLRYEREELAAMNKIIEMGREAEKEQLAEKVKEIK
jgi:hypothetical protein